MPMLIAYMQFGMKLFLKYYSCLILEKTSLKIFKHYKLKPSFSIVKDDKTKDWAGVRDKPPPTNFGKSINPNLT